MAHAIDNASTGFSGNVPVKGNSDNDVRQIFNAAINYQVPFHGSRKVSQILLGKWLLANRFEALSGYPLNVIQSYYFLPNGGQAYFQPDLVPGVPVYRHDTPGVLGGWSLNPAAFSPVPTNPVTGAPLRNGTVGRNAFHGPAFWSLNTAVQKEFPLHEKMNLLFRVDAFNLFNHANAGNIQTYLTSSQFGISAGPVSTVGSPNSLYATGAPRSLQLMLKLRF